MDTPIFIAQLAVIALLGVMLIALVVVDEVSEPEPAHRYLGWK